MPRGGTTTTSMDQTTRMVLSLITDEWMDAEDLMADAMPRVSPGVALRHYDTRHDKYLKEMEARDGWVPKPPLSDADRIRSGQRAMINSRLHNLVANGWVEMEYGDNRHNRRVKRSYERAWANRCCLHGGTCKGSLEDSPDASATKLTRSPEVTRLLVLEALRGHMDFAPWRLADATGAVLAALGVKLHDDNGSVT